MPKKSQLTQNERNLIRRYLIWCYKTTKEDLDKVDRYFTQAKADDVILKKLKSVKECRISAQAGTYADAVDQFQAYMTKKEDNALKKKFKDGKGKVLNPEYQYLLNRFAAIEGAVSYFLGGTELKKIAFLYEEEMTRRILQAREHD